MKATRVRTIIEQLSLTPEMLERISDGFLALNRDGYITYINQKAAFDLGRRPQDLIGKNLFEKYRQIVNTELELKLQQVLVRQKPQEFEIQNVPAPGCYKIRIYPSGSGLFVYWQDITVQKKMGDENLKLLEDCTLYQEELESQEKELEAKARELEAQALPDYARVGRVTLSSEGYILDVDTSAASMLGLPKNKLINTILTKYIQPEFKSAFHVHLYQTLESRAPQHCDVKMLHSPDKEFMARLESNPVKNAEGKVNRIRTFISDVTFLREIEGSLRVSEERLRSAVSVPYIMLAETDLDLKYVWVYNPIDGVVDPFIGKRDDELYPGEDGHQLVNLKQQVLESGRSQQAEWSLNRPDGRHYYDLYLRPRYNSNGEKSGLSTATIDITSRKQAEAELQQIAEKRQHLLQLSNVVVAEKDLKSLLTKVAKASLALTGGRVAVSLYSNGQGEFDLGSASWAEGQSFGRPEKTFHIERGVIYQELLQSQPSIRLTQEQIVKHPAWRGLPQKHAPLKGLLGARFTDENQQANGMIMVSDKAVGDFTALDEYFLHQLASIVSLALQHIEARHKVEEDARELEAKVKERTRELSELNEQLKEYGRRIVQAQEEERKRIAYELHDDTAQYLSILKLQVDGLLRNGKIQDPEILKKLEYLERDADRAITDVRRYSHELRPSVMEHLGLRAALEQIAEDTNKLKEVPVKVSARGTEPNLSEDVKLAFFRVAQEALNNARKHARASWMNIDIRFNLHHLTMTVSDDGMGFDLSESLNRSKGRGSLGLMSMQERAQLINADLKIDSAPGKGTRVTLKANF